MSSRFHCSICLEAVRVSTVLPCGHDFCKACLEDWAKAAAKESVSCPKCRLKVPIQSLPGLPDRYHGLLSCAVCETPKPAFRLQFCRECGTHQCSDCAWDPCHTAKAHALSPFHKLSGVARLKRSLNLGAKEEEDGVAEKMLRVAKPLLAKLQARLISEQPIKGILSRLVEAFGPLEEAPDSRFDDTRAAKDGRELLGLMGVDLAPAESGALEDPTEGQTDDCIDALLGKKPALEPTVVPFSPLHRGIFVAKPSEVDGKGVPRRMYEIVGATRLRVYVPVDRSQSYTASGKRATFTAGIAELVVCGYPRNFWHRDKKLYCIELTRTIDLAKINSWE